MEHTDNQDRIVTWLVEDHMRLLPDAAQTWRNFASTAPKHRVFKQGVETGPELVAVFACLLDPEFRNGEISDVRKIVSSPSAEAQFTHQRRGAPLRTRSYRVTFR